MLQITPYASEARRSSCTRAFRRSHSLCLPCPGIRNWEQLPRQPGLLINTRHAGAELNSLISATVFQVMLNLLKLRYQNSCKAALASVELWRWRRCGAPHGRPGQEGSRHVCP